MEEYLLSGNIAEKVTLHYQPIISYDKKNIYKYEALARLQGPGGVLYQPDDFLPFIQKYGFYNELTIAVAKAALTALKDNPVIGLSININYLDIKCPNTVKRLKEHLLAHGLDVSSRLTFELLETNEVEDYNLIIIFQRMIAQFDSKLAIDDFGTGFSNLAHLINIKFDYLKIAGELIEDLNNNKVKIDMLEAISMYCRAQNIKIIAEKVETIEVARTLFANGIDLLQGYYFAKPMSIFVEKVDIHVEI